MSDGGVDIALFLPELYGGGAERVFLNLARAMVGKGLAVDLVVGRARGEYITHVPAGVRLVDLKARRTATSLPHLTRYLHRERPRSLLSALTRANLTVVWAKQLACVPTRVLISIHSMFSIESAHFTQWSEKVMPLLVKRFYGKADGIIAVSQGAAEDIAQLTGVPRERIQIIYNPVIYPELFTAAQEPITHPYFAPESPPVILSVGRLEEVKDYGTLIRAFATLRQRREARLLILGEGSYRQALTDLIAELGLEREVSLPGFATNPYAYMSRSRVFALCSKREALPTVLIESIACGTPVVSTDCPTGPREILAEGRYGRLVPVGDSAALACALEEALEGRGIQALRQSLEPFLVDKVTSEYIQALLPDSNQVE